MTVSPVPDPYVYKVVDVVRVVDADTIDAKIGFGFGVTATFRFRLFGVDAPETFGPHASLAGRAAADFTAAWLLNRQGRLYVRTYKGSQATVGLGDGAYGRWAGDFFSDGEHLADALIAAELGKLMPRNS